MKSRMVDYVYNSSTWKAGGGRGGGGLSWVWVQAGLHGKFQTTLYIESSYLTETKKQLKNRTKDCEVEVV